MFFAISSNSCYLQIGCGVATVAAANRVAESSQLQPVAELASPAASVSERIETNGQQRRLVAI